MEIDYQTGFFIGAGERAAFKIIKDIFNLGTMEHEDFPSAGIYKQIPLKFLLNRRQFSILRKDLQQGSIDILVITKDYQKIAIRVQGRKGNLKMHREGLQQSFLEAEGIKVIDLHKRECKELFKDRINEKSINEVKEAFKTAKISLEA